MSDDTPPRKDREDHDDGILGVCAAKPTAVVLCNVLRDALCAFAYPCCMVLQMPPPPDDACTIITEDGQPVTIAIGIQH